MVCISLVVCGASGDAGAGGNARKRLRRADGGVTLRCLCFSQVSFLEEHTAGVLPNDFQIPFGDTLGQALKGKEAVWKRCLFVDTCWQHLLAHPNINVKRVDEHKHKRKIHSTMPLHA